MSRQKRQSRRRRGNFDLFEPRQMMDCALFEAVAGAMDDASDIVTRVCQGEGASANVRVLGPAPAPLARLRGEYRAQFLVKGTNRRRMREGLLVALASRPDVQRRIVVDVDPVNLL